MDNTQAQDSKEAAEVPQKEEPLIEAIKKIEKEYQETTQTVEELKAKQLSLLQKLMPMQVTFLNAIIQMEQEKRTKAEAEVKTLEEKLSSCSVSSSSSSSKR